MKYTIVLFLFIIFFSCSTNRKNDEGTTTKKDTVALADSSSDTIHERAIDEYLNEVNNTSAFSGFILITANGNKVYERYFGTEDLRGLQPINAQSLFPSDFMLQEWLAHSLIYLEQENKLSISEPLSGQFSFLKKTAGETSFEKLLVHEFAIPSKLPFCYSKQDSAKFIAAVNALPSSSISMNFEGELSFIELLLQKKSNYRLTDFLKEKHAIDIQDYCDDSFDTSRVIMSYEYSDRWGKKAFTGKIFPSKTYCTPEALFKWMQKKKSFLKSNATDKLYKRIKNIPGTGSLEGYTLLGKSINARSGSPLIITEGKHGFYTYCKIEDVQNNKEVIIYSNNNNKNCLTHSINLLKILSGEPIQNNSNETSVAFESKASELVYQTFIEKGSAYFSANIETDLKKKSFPSNDPFIYLEAGQKLIQENKIDLAHTFYQFYTNKFPENTIGWNDFGEIALKKNDKKNAAIYFRKTLAIQPENERAKRMLKQCNE